MFNKSFEEMMQIDVTPYVKQRDGADYLNWAVCKKLLHDNGAEEVTFYPVPAPDGSTLRMSIASFTDKNGMINRVYEVLVHIKVDDIEWNIAYPVMNGNNPVKDNSMNQLRVHNAVRRAFVKGVAERIGLGFSLWLDEDDLPQDDTDDLSSHSLAKIRQRFEEIYSSKHRMGLSSSDIAKALGMTTDEVKAIFANFDTLMRFEENLKAIKV